MAGAFLAAALLLTAFPSEGVGDEVDGAAILAQARRERVSGNTATALALLDSLPADDPRAEEAGLERASLLIASGRASEATTFLASHPFHGRETRAEATYLQGIAALREGRRADASKAFSSVASVTPWLSQAASLGSILSDPGTGPARGIRLLEKQIAKGGDPTVMERQFRLLDSLYAATRQPEAAVFETWAADASDPARLRLARFYRSKGDLRLGRAAQGEAGLTAYLKDYPSDSLSGEARLLLALSKFGRGSHPEVLITAADNPSDPSPLRARMAYLRGMSESATGASDRAKADFSLAGQLAPKLAGDALFNRALLIAASARGCLDQSDEARAIAASGGGAGEEMGLQIAFDAARRGDPSTADTLRSLADRSGDPSIRSRARVAAAELDMTSGKGESAMADFSKALRDGSPQPEREEYLRIFLCKEGADLTPVCRAFLSSHPESPFAPDVRLRLAEALLACGDLQGARAELELLAATAPGGDLSRDSLFLAARSASGAMDPGSIDDALMLLDRVAARQVPDRLSWQARIHEGALKVSQGLPVEALAIDDRVIASVGSDPELLSATLMAKGDTLHEKGTSDAASERLALETWNHLASDSTLPLARRLQALCKSGRVLEQLGEPDAALASFDQAFHTPATDPASAIWRDKAAFEAARLLEKSQRWNEAVALYDALISEGGARSGEAKARLSKLRLENFLWDN